MEIAEILREEEIVSYVATALAIGAVYDHRSLTVSGFSKALIADVLVTVITLDREIELVWKRTRWTVAQFLFLTSRYLSDAILIYGAIIQTTNYHTSHSEVRVCIERKYICLSNIFIRCRTPFLVVDWGSLIAYWASQGIMIFRVSSIYDHHRSIIGSLLCAFGVEIAITSVMNGLTTTSLLRTYHMTIYEPLGRCLPSLTPQAPNHYWTIFWIPIMIFEILILALSVHRALQYRSTLWADNRTTISGRQSLIYILLRDSLLFPFIGLSICFLNFMGSIYFSFSSTQICIIIAGFSTQILGSRLVLNLREAYYQSFSDEFSLDRISLPIEFVGYDQPQENPGSGCSGCEP